MNADDNERRRQRLRELQQMRGKVASDPAPTEAAAAEGGTERGTKLREMMRRRKARGAGDTLKGGGKLLQALAARGGGAGAGADQGRAALREALAKRGQGAAGAAGEATLDAEGKGAGGAGGDRGAMLRRIMQARQGREGGQQGQGARVLVELQNQMRELTEAVERLRADLSGRVIAASAPQTAATAAEDVKRDAPATSAPNS